MDHSTLVYFAKTFGLFYLIALAIGVLIYACWPRNRQMFDKAARSIIDDEDKPCR